MERWTAIKNKIVSDKKVLLLLSVFLIGVFLLALSGSGRDNTRTRENPNGENGASAEKELEERVTKLLSTVDGVGRVKVMITLECMNETVYAKDEENSGDGERYSGKYVTVEKSGDKTGLEIKTLSPVVRGVAISCEGGGSARIRQEVTSLICACLGINANRVYVSKYGT